jgi:hypothetical protein
MRSTWTDSRLDDFKDRVDSRFDDLDNRVSELSARVGELDTRITGRIDGLQHTMVQAFIALMVAMFTGFVGLAGLIVTQL